jgi:hypothetical protein
LKEASQFTLRAIELWFAALEITTVDLLVSGDGGENYSSPLTLNLPLTGGRIGSIWATFEGLEEATGDDLRVRIEFDQDELSIIYGYRPHLVDRGDLII